MKRLIPIFLVFVISISSVVCFAFAANIPDLELLPDGIDNFPNGNYDSKEYLLYKENSSYGLIHFQSEPTNLRYRVLDSSCDLTPRVNSNKYRFNNGEWRYSSTVSDVSLFSFSKDFTILYSTVDVYDADGNIIRIADEETFGSNNSDNEDSEINKTANMVREVSNIIFEAFRGIFSFFLSTPLVVVPILIVFIISISILSFGIIK